MGDAVTNVDNLFSCTGNGDDVELNFDIFTINDYSMSQGSHHRHQNPDYGDAIDDDYCDKVDCFGNFDNVAIIGILGSVEDIVIDLDWNATATSIKEAIVIDHFISYYLEPFTKVVEDMQKALHLEQMVRIQDQWAI